MRFMNDGLSTCSVIRWCCHDAGMSHGAWFLHRMVLFWQGRQQRVRCAWSGAQVNWYGKEDVRVVGDEGDLVKRSLGAVESWETPRAPFEVGPAAARTGPGVVVPLLLLRLQSCKCGHSCNSELCFYNSLSSGVSAGLTWSPKMFRGAFRII